MIYAIGDLHLAMSSDKPMDIFGPQWENHAAKIAQNWQERVSQEDLVLVPGDISWGMTLEEAQTDLDFLGTLPGRKVMIRGNHDYWWSGIQKVRSALPDGLQAIQNDAIDMGDVVVCGTRGWLIPTHPNFNPEDEKLYLRETERLRLSLEAARRFRKPIVCMLHYPPCGADGAATHFTELLEQYGVQRCLYGHLHGHAHRFAFEGEKHGIHYQLVSADYVDFTPVPVHSDGLDAMNTP